ncbi:ATP-binding cassette domain-containing protein [Methylogaea oryzae]|uniref:Nod factor export ATP-binding protein I n=1 Tax=Methylogaea oryzae TaxID=1295382 RepID=A0A8D4VP30_9GAMM|nr:ATP-binding cassette domain-containing protein [Methylogaea oryzae]BBL70764.1 Nod factor export ATP-binding protein I [Methylogaea oryzae]
MKDAVVRADGLSKRYGGHRVVDGISFSIPRGEFCGILGPNGAGKTTTLRMLAGHAPPDGGELTVLGFPVPKRAKDMRALVGIVPQQDNLDLELTVRENLEVYGRYFGLSSAEVRDRIPQLLQYAALPDKADQRIGNLSGGMKRRLSIARALINRPRLLILDEPTTGLDPHIRHNIWQLLRQLQQDGLTVILTTHYMDEAERLCDRIILMDHGRILADGAPRDLIAGHIESHVLEVHGQDVARWRETFVCDEPVRRERVGDSLYLYGEQLQPWVASLDAWPRLRYSYRPANLEDVFLRLTGRDLRDV